MQLGVIELHGLQCYQIYKNALFFTCGSQGYCRYTVSLYDICYCLLHATFSPIKAAIAKSKNQGLIFIGKFSFCLIRAN